MANKKFSEFVLKTSTSDVSHIVGYNGAENVQITPANFVTTGGTGVFLPLAGGTMTGALVVDSTATVNDILTAGLGLALTGGTVGSGKLVLASTNKVHLSGGSAGLVLQNTGGTKSLTIDDTLSTFVGLVSGITPVDAANFVTKAYADGLTPGAGVFLPLAGGTLTGALIGTTATFRGNVEVIDPVSGNFNGEIKVGGTGSNRRLLLKQDTVLEYLIGAEGSGSLLKFGTGTGALEKMRLDDSGNLGINEDSPAAKLVVNQDSLVDTQGIFVQSASNPADGGIAIFKSASKVGTISALGGGSSLSFMTNGGSEKMRINDDGDLLIGTTGVPNGTSIYGSAFRANSNARMSLNMASSSSGAQGHIEFFNPNGLVGSIITSGSATSYNTSSDYRLKEDLQDFKGLDLVSKIPVYDYKWKADKSRSYGVMAHELKEVLPQAVSGEKDAEEMQAVDYSKIVPLLVKSIQELSAKLEALECQCEKK